MSAGVPATAAGMALLLAFLSSGCAGYFDAERAEAASRTRLDQLYESRLGQWSVPYEAHYLPTRYGDTHVVACGPSGAPAIVLLHAMGLNATQWGSVISELAQENRVYAVDTIGDLGRSKLVNRDNYPNSGKLLAEWLREVLDGLGEDKADIVGSSMGGWIAAHFAAHAPERTRRLVLLGPVGVTMPWKVMLRLVGVALLPTQGNKESLIRWTLGSSPRVQEELGSHMAIAVDCRPRLAMPRMIEDDTLSSIQAPTLVILGGQDHPIGNPQKVGERIRRFVSSCDVVVLPEAGHVMNIEKPESIVTLIRKFVDKNPDHCD